MTTSSHGFHHKRTVRFGECDPAGVVYYPIYFDWFHQAMEACFETHLGVTYASVIETVGFPAVNTSATFRYPISVGEQLTVVVSIASLGRSSVLWNFHIYNEQERLCAVGEVKTVCIPVSTGVFAFESVEIPEDLRPKLLTLENH